MRTTISEQGALASRLRKCYQFERNNLSRILNKPAHYRVPACWDGGDVEKKKNTLWHRLARFCTKREIDPTHYVQWCLNINQLGLNPPPEPNQLLSPRRMDAYRDNQDKQREAIRISLRVQITTSQTQFGYLKFSGLKAEDAWASTLCDGSIALSPLLRYVLALRIGGERFLKIARHKEQEALLQYQRNPAAYDTYLSSLVRVLPADFAERAAALYDQLLAQEP